MSKDIRWLHLSDLHIGSTQSKFNWLDLTIRQKLIEKVNEIGPIDFILITGDFVDRGKFTDYDIVSQAKDLVNGLKKISENVLFAIGNHDYCQNKSRFELLSKWEKLSLSDKVEQEKDYANKLKADFNNYVDFCKEITNKDNPIITGTYVSKISDLALNIVVLNTSIFAGQPILDTDGNESQTNVKKMVDDHKLWISQSDLPTIRNLNESYPTIVVGHHPLQMFEDNLIDLLKTFFKGIHAKYYFCGHIHKSEDKMLGEIEQLASAGLFDDDKNLPTFAVYTMHSYDNGYIEPQRYRYENGDWKITVSSSPSVDKEARNGSLEMNHAETSTSRRAPFVIMPSQTSDGAFQFDYNGGKFNLYRTEENTPSMVTPHYHKDLDEIVYVIRGRIYVYVDGTCTLVSMGNAVLLPKGKYHAFIPRDFPSEYLVIGVETEGQGQYESRWREDIEKINKLDADLSNCSPQKADIIYEQMISYLSSSVLEVNWEAKKYIKKYLALNNDDSTFLNAALQKMVLGEIRSTDREKKLLGLNMACEFGTRISIETLSNLMTDKQEYMYAWNCAYYLLKWNTEINYENMLDKLENRENKEDLLTCEEYRCLYYEEIIISLIQLMKEGTSRRFEALYDKWIGRKDLENVMPIDEIIIHFVLWDNECCRRIDFGEAKQLIPDLPGLSGEEILRSLLCFDQTQTRYRVLRSCQEGRKLKTIVSSCFGAIKKERESSMDDSFAKEKIKTYLRIIVSERCNLDCVYCHHEGREDSLIGSQISNNNDFDLRKLLNYAKELGFRKIKISGGEPLLYPDVLEICNEFQNDFEDIGFTTNGTNINALKSEFDKIVGSKLSFNVSLNSINPIKYKRITGSDTLREAQEGIDYLVKNKFHVKINSVITSYNVDEIENLVAYAARKKINIKLLDLFPIGELPDDVQPVSLAEINNRLVELYSPCSSNLSSEGDYYYMEAMGIRILLPHRLYTSKCLYNCSMYPCAEGFFGIRVFEDYSCAYCFGGDVYKGGLEKFVENIGIIRRHLDGIRFCL